MTAYSSAPQRKTKIEVEKIVEVCWQGARGGSSATFVKELKIPRTMMCSNSRYCYVVQITYELKVEVEIDRWNGSIEVHFPITIGSVPITSNQPRAAIVPTVHNSNSPQVPRNAGFIAPPPATLNHAFIARTPPPTFEEAMKMDSP